MSDPVIRLTRAQVREVDRRAIEEYAMPGIVLMENAALHAADVAWNMLHKSPNQPTVHIVCGGGNNGGDGLAIARHLHNRGAKVRVIMTVDPAKLTGDALINWRIVARSLSDIAVGQAAQQALRGPDPDLLVDAIVGTGLTHPPREDAALFIDSINATHRPILAIDVPSGLDCDTGLPLARACVRATHTVTFVAQKLGFANPASQQYTGQVTVADIGCPQKIIEEILQSQ